MSFSFSGIKWSWVVIGAIVATVIGLLVALTVQFGYGLVIGFQLRGSPPQEMLIEAFTSLPFLIIGVVATTIGALVGIRMAVRRSVDNPQMAGLIAGIVTAVLVFALRIYQWGLDIWMLPNVAAAVIVGWLIGWLVARRAAQPVQPSF